MSSVHVSPLKVYISIFAALMVLSAITVAVAFVNLGTFNKVVALGIAGLKATGIEMDRKVLAAIAYDDPAAFAEVVKQVQAVMAAAAEATGSPAPAGGPLPTPPVMNEATMAATDPAHAL